MFSTRWIALAALPLLFACGGKSSKGKDHGSPSATYPAPHTALPQLFKYSGINQTSPVLYPVTWPGDPIAAQLDDFTSKIGASTYWTATTLEYGVGPAVLGTAIHMTTAAPAAISATEIDALVASIVDGTHPTWGAPSTESQYVFYFPAGTVVDGNVGCQDYLAYHSSAVVAGGSEVAYAVIPRCGAFGNNDELGVATESASHEMVEAATDPFSNVAWVDLDDKNGAWDYMSGGGENADLCQDIANVDANPADLGYVVQRSWSNAAAAASHDPCQPTTAVYFNAAPVLPDTATINFGGGFTLDTGAVKIPVGGSRTIELDLFSDAATTAPFTVHATDIAGYYGYPTELAFTFDRSTGVNGEKVYLTVHVDRAGAFYTGGNFFWVVADLGTAEQYWPVFVKN